MGKEAQEKLSKLRLEVYGAQLTERDIEQILTLIIPKDKPPLLSEEEIEKIEKNWFNTPLDKRVDPEMLIAQAQREADIKFYAGATQVI